ncbi:MAG TPA: hypothetical protein DCZ61_08670 [Lachnospiraceae bacterium]|nr:hypothetical protein [Lachnospiraceae bacterium]
MTVLATYIHYGSDYYNPSLTSPARNRAGNTKPADGTGLWAEREGDVYEDRKVIYGWKKWCEDTKYRVEKLKRNFRFRLSDDANLLVLQKPEDLLPLPKTAAWELKDASALRNLPAGEFPTMEQLHEFYGRNPCCLDFEKLLADGVDAIELRNSYLFGRYLIYWDCDCLLVLNPAVIVPLMDTSDHVLIQPGHDSRPF